MKRRWALVPGVVLCAWAALVLHEWWIIGYIADAETIARYPFGAECAGPTYKTADIYAATALKEGLVFSILTLPFFLAGWLRSHAVLVMAYLTLIPGFGAVA